MRGHLGRYVNEARLSNGKEGGVGVSKHSATPVAAEGISLRNIVASV